MKAPTLAELRQVRRMRVLNDEEYRPNAVIDALIEMHKTDPVVHPECPCPIEWSLSIIGFGIELGMRIAEWREAQRKAKTS